LDAGGDLVPQTRAEIGDGYKLAPLSPWFKPIAAADKRVNAEVHPKISEAAGGPPNLYN
jgi:hypothetical protein